MVLRPHPGFAFSHPAHAIAFGFGVGLAPFAPGTAGTALGWAIGWALGAAGYLMKPVGRERLAELLRKFRTRGGEVRAYENVGAAPPEATVAAALASAPGTDSTGGTR